jgi:hypothetical protein
MLPGTTVTTEARLGVDGTTRTPKKAISIHRQQCPQYQESIKPLVEGRKQSKCDEGRNPKD